METGFVVIVELAIVDQGFDLDTSPLLENEVLLTNNAALLLVVLVALVDDFGGVHGNALLRNRVQVVSLLALQTVPQNVDHEAIFLIILDALSARQLVFVDAVADHTRSVRGAPQTPFRAKLL